MEELILTVFGAVVTFAISLASAKFAKLSGIQIEEKHQRALHQALTSGAHAALNKGPQAGIDEVARHAIEHAKKSVPDALEALMPDAPVLQTLGARYAQEALRGHRIRSLEFLQ